jgi:hypothetical protein
MGIIGLSVCWSIMGAAIIARVKGRAGSMLQQGRHQVNNQRYRSSFWPIMPVDATAAIRNNDPRAGVVRLRGQSTAGPRCH